MLHLERRRVDQLDVVRNDVEERSTMHFENRRLAVCTRGFLLAALITLATPFSASARWDGIDRAGTGCGGCHGGAATGSLSVTVSGPATVAPSSTTTYTLTVVDPGGFAGAGFSVGTNAGSLAVVDANTQILGSSVNHLDAWTATPGGSLGDWSYDFDLIAPATLGTPITLAFSGLAFDGDFSNNGDQWNTGSFAVVTGLVPEPGTGLLMGMGLAILGIVGRRRKLH
jgi:hypothetical protein